MTSISALPDVAVHGFHLPLSAVVLGMLSGLTFGLLAVGLVLIYRTSRIINFAHGQMGAFGVAVLSLLTHKYHVPYYVALIPGLAAGGLAAGATELVVIRRLRNTTPVMSIVATLGVGAFLTEVASVVDSSAFSGVTLPSPPGMPVINLGDLRIDEAYTAMLILGPATVAALTLFLRYSRFGLAIRCSSANPESARLAGISTQNMSSLSWVMAGVLSALTALLVIPASGFSSSTDFGPPLLLRALTAGVIARMYSLPIAFGAGVLIGVVQQVVLFNYPNSDGLPDLVFYVLILVVLLSQRSARGRAEEKGSWASVASWKPLPARVARLPEVRGFRWGLTGIGLVVALLLPLLVSNASAVSLSTVIAYAIVGVSVGIGTGLSGQLSLGQFAVAGVGAVVSFHLDSSVPFPLALIIAALGGAAISLAIGIPALRLKGLMLTVTTLGFALMANGWGLEQNWALGGGTRPERPAVFGKALDTGRSYYYVALAAFLIVLLIAWNVRRLAFGRALLAVRDNESNARAFTVRVTRLKIQGFALAGFIAGFGGAIYGHLLSSVDASTFSVQASIDTVAMTVIGGVGLLIGPLIGAFYVIGLPRFLPLDAAGIAATDLGWLILILYLPGGIAQGLEPLRTRYVRWAAARHGLDIDTEKPILSESARAGRLAVVVEPRQAPARPHTALLDVRGLRKSFGGIAAVRDVSLSVHQGEVVGLIGPNGAGKTTTFELISGFTRPNQGQVHFNGDDVSSLSPERRGRLGLIRSFQDAALFPTLTVAETVRLAFEPRLATSFSLSVLGLPGTEKEKARRASDLVDIMGLGSYRAKQIQELSTGTRRITELACMIALAPTLLLLDEPSSGVAQRETEALGVLLRRLKDELDLTMLVIEHDIPLIMGMADRVVVMDVGTVIADGSPDEVQADPLVIDAYLGASATVLHRSSSVPRPAAVETASEQPSTAIAPTV
ncbi:MULTISPECIES: ABC transporter permease subunit [Pseudofrankia]|uniref:ABC transporter permease subunit n=1 Tax=Pseudofrankia TaxID=2994363 RepID=UPI000234C745|nr:MULTISPECIES: ATP-binding cassette domain-containing protein [Pseudofrankia]OHV33211.1 hypothetical protein BCD49_27615 [Pseudofrankia sp. EUN1h]